MKTSSLKSQEIEDPQTGPPAISSLWPRLIGGLLLASGVLVSYSWYAREVLDGKTMSFDLAVREAIHQIASPSLTMIMVTLSFIGSPGFLLILGLAFVAGSFMAGWRRATLIFIITMAGELVLDLTLKAAFVRVRPDPYFDYPLPPSSSFPSGHALGSLCFFGIVAWLLSQRMVRPWSIWPTCALAALLILSIGFSRIYLGVHYPTDVLAGYIAAIIWTSTVIASDYYIGRRNK